ncbi:MAG: hypothetical protein K2N12_01275 [Helicobacter sp.]|nr:hypothetical protein [Helicobacter sp.]
MANETLSDKVDRILAEYDNIIARSNQTNQHYTEIVAIRNSIASLKNTLTSEIATAKSQIKEANDTLIKAQRIGIDIEGKGKSYVDYITKTLDSIEVVGNKTQETLDKAVETVLKRIAEQTLEDTSELTNLGKNLKWDLQQCADTLKTELSPFLEQLNNANAAIEELIGRARSAADAAETTKGDVLLLLENARADAQETQKNHEMLVTQSQNIKTQLSELCDKSIAHLESANALVERFKALKDELGEADIEALFQEILTNDKREVLGQIIDSLIAQENAQAILSQILADGTQLLSDIKREGSKAIGSITSLKAEAENAHIKGLDEIRKESLQGYTKINELYNEAITEIRKVREMSLDKMNAFKDDVKQQILQHLTNFNRNVQECVQMLLQSYHDFQHQLKNSKQMLEDLRDSILIEMDTKHETLSQKLCELYKQCEAKLLTNKDKTLSEIIAQKDATLKELQTFFENLRLECAFLKQSLSDTIEKAQDTIEVIVKGSFKKEIHETLNNTYWNNALTLAQLLDAYFIKVEAHHRINNSEQILAQVKREKAIVVDARGLVAKSLDETRILSTRLREYAAMAEWNSFMEVI